jgi:hypothetical protein
LSKLDDLKDDFKEHKQVIKEVIDEKFKIHNQIYFNGYEPHEHIKHHDYIKSIDQKKAQAHEMIIENIVEEMQDNKKNTHKMIWGWIDRAFWAALTFVAYSTWIGFQEKVADIPTKPKTEQSQNANTPKHP